MPELLDRDGILDSLAALAAELEPARHQHVLVLVGGAQMTLHGLRPSTHDVESRCSGRTAGPPRAEEAVDHLDDRAYPDEARGPCAVLRDVTDAT